MFKHELLYLTCDSPRILSEVVQPGSVWRGELNNGRKRDQDLIAVSCADEAANDGRVARCKQAGRRKSLH